MDSRTVKLLIDNYEQKPEELARFIKSYPFWMDTYWEMQSRYKDEYSRPETEYRGNGHDETTSVTIDHEATLLGYALNQNKPLAALLLIPKTSDFLKGYHIFENHSSSTHGPMGGITNNDRRVEMSETPALETIDASNNQELITALFNRIIELNLFKNNRYRAFIKKHFPQQQTSLQADCTESELNTYLQTKCAEMNPEVESKASASSAPSVSTSSLVASARQKRPLTQEEKTLPQTEGDTFNLKQSAQRVLTLKSKYLKLSAESKKDYKHFTPLKNSFGPSATLFSQAITADTIQALAKNITGSGRVFNFDKENTAENREKIAEYLNKSGLRK